MELGIIILVAYFLFFVHLILTIYSCNKNYFIIDSIIISIIIFLVLIIHYRVTHFISPTFIYSFLYICIRGIIVLILFLIKRKNNHLIKLKKCSFNHILFMAINLVINIILIIWSTYNIITGLQMG
jgi:hypothetical protein